MTIGGISLSLLLLYALIGFIAQCIDGMLGMAGGVICRTCLRSITKAPTAMASAVVHCTKLFTCFVSGLSHLTLKNVFSDWLWRLIIPGVIGGVLGAWLVTGVGDVLEPFVDSYLIVMGIIILLKALDRKRKNNVRRARKRLWPLGFAGGFLDACGGGGWGPVVTSTLLASDQDVQKTIGTVNTAEFVVTLAETTTFVILLHDMISFWPIIVAVALGGLVAAPFAAWLCKKIPPKPLMGCVGVMVMGLNIYNLIHWLIQL